MCDSTAWKAANVGATRAHVREPERRSRHLRVSLVVEKSVTSRSPHQHTEERSFERERSPLDYSVFSFVAIARGAPQRAAETRTQVDRRAPRRERVD